ncbi:hypothetical protein IEO21_02991 [Rhodonia placenta]|uniref:Uncharacterized protein n=1 Tax=Rhodonia placenta TaxID=104341 RepID=A0A8H7P6G3_9APHY|nr:hypothetical protein IEO21_02991 [Postia placenta]
MDPPNRGQNPAVYDDRQPGLPNVARKSANAPRAPARKVALGPGAAPVQRVPSGHGAPNAHRSRGIATKTMSRQVNAQRDARPVADQHVRAHSPPRLVSRKRAYVDQGRNAQAQFTFTAPLPSRLQRPTKTTSLRPWWFTEDEHSNILGIRRRRDQNDVGGRQPPRMMAMSAGGSRRAQARARSPALLVRQNGHAIPMPRRGGFIVGPGGVLHKLTDSDDDDEDPSAASRNIRTHRTQLATKAAIKGGLQFGSDSNRTSRYHRLRANDDDDEYYPLKGLSPIAIPPQELAERVQTSVTDDTDQEESYEKREGRMLDWRCPLCQLHSPFDTREMLNFHLCCDHSEVKISTWRITLTIPELDDELSEEEETTEEESSDDEEVHETHEKLQPAPLALPEPVSSHNRPSSARGAGPDHASGQTLWEMSREVEQRIASMHQRLSDPTLLSDSEDNDTPEATHPPPEPMVLVRVEEEEPRIPISEPAALPRAPQPISAAPPEPVLIFKKFRAFSPTLSHTASAGARTRSTTTQTRSSRGLREGRYPTPPPPSDPLGPAAQPPFLPTEPAADGELYYSCRLGGPRIFDLLNTLPLDRFGVMAWAITDREEDLFELDDVRDEDKVILALWNRWIMLNRGVIDFVDEYWFMIHRAAGWDALRAFLLVLAANKFLDAPEVARILKHYETHTGMDYWYQDDDDDDDVDDASAA